MLNNRLLPKVILIADQFTDEGIRDRMLDAINAGILWVHLRDHAADEAVFEEHASKLKQCIESHNPNVLITVNRRLQVAKKLGTHFHTSAKGPGVLEARGRLKKNSIIGFSAHTREEAESVRDHGVDYLFLSPIFPTSSKEGHPGIGLEELARISEAVSPLPVFALGGITSSRVSECRKAGAYGVAAISGILSAPDTAESTRGFLDREQ